MKKINSLIDIKDFVIDLETKYKVIDWKVNGIDVWPYIRIKIFITLLSRQLNSESSEEKSNVQITPKPIGRFWLNFIYFFKSIYLILRLVLKLKNKKYLLFGDHYQRIHFKDKMFNRFHDSLIDLYDLKKVVYVFEYGRPTPNSWNNDLILNINKIIKAFEYTYKPIKLFKNQKINQVKLYGYTEFYDEIKSIDLPSLSIQNLIKWSQKINRLSKYYNFLFKIIKPSHIVFTMYYDLDVITAALFSAKRLNVKTIDLQHGPQINHLAFSHWKIPSDKSFNTMVDEFWVWDDFSFNSIERWSTKNNSVKVKLIGNPLINYLRNSDSKEGTREKPKHYIIYSLQLFSINKMFSKHVIQLIHSLDFKWIIRLHPRNSFSVKELNDFLKQNKIKDKCSIQNASDCLLPEAFLTSFIHITNFSGCLIEAKLCNVPTIVIDEIGKNTYNEFIDNKSVFYVDKRNTEFVKEATKIIKNIKTFESLIPTFKSPFKE